MQTRMSRWVSIIRVGGSGASADASSRHWRRPAPSAPRFVARPVSGLTSGHAPHDYTVTFPDPMAQWLPLVSKRPTMLSLDYRCGGSVGIARFALILTSRLTGLLCNPAPDAAHVAVSEWGLSSAVLPSHTGSCDTAGYEFQNGRDSGNAYR